MKVVIVAAGSGSRLTGSLASKPLTLLRGKPLIQHVMEAAIAANTSGTDPHFSIVTGWQPGLIENFVRQMPADFPASVSTIHCPDWQKGNGASLLEMKNHLSEPFNILMSDHIFDPALLAKLNQTARPGTALSLAVDCNLENPLVDIDDVTRVLTSDGAIVNIAKHLQNYNAFDTGCFYCTPALFSALEQAQLQHNDFGISGAVKVLAGTGDARVIDVTGSRWIDVDTPQMLEKAAELVE